MMVILTSMHLSAYVVVLIWYYVYCICR